MSLVLQSSDGVSNEVDNQADLDSPLYRSFELFVDEDSVFSSVEEELRKIAKTAKWPGFRPGKVPLKMISNRHRDSVLHEVIRTSLNMKLRQKINDESWLMCKLISADLFTHKEGEGWVFKVEIEIFPDLDFEDWQDIKATIYSCEVQPGDVDTAITRLRKGMADLVDKDGPATSGDCVFIKGDVYFSEKESGEIVQRPLSVMVSLDDPSESLQSSLLGSEVGDKLHLNWVPPVSWQGVPAGVDARLEVLVDAVKKLSVPDVDRCFLDRLGLPEEEGEENMREEIFSLLSFHAEKMLAQWTEMSFFCGLMEKIKIVIPKSIKEDISKNYMAYLQRNHFAARRLGAVSNLQKAKDDFLDPVFVDYLGFREVLTVLLTRSANFTVSGEELKAAMLEEMKFNPSQNLFKDSRKLDLLTSLVRTSLLMKKIIFWLIERCQTSKHVFDFEELLRIESSAEPDLEYRARIESVSFC
ncbi:MULTISPECIES: trigger factor [Candidatus Ichthyocystis]|uniref:trigger factor n=1 Tax=Candidatus Ichthyocystis TaxID=2929841 RepID=UPI000A7CEF07|nr:MULTISPECIES: trigger factor [Ichthyocystis]